MEERERTDDDSIEIEPTDTDEAELEDVDEQNEDKIKKLRKKLADCESEKMKHLEDLQRTKADFLNSRKRLEEQSQRDRERITESHILELLPLADSFNMATQDPAWNLCDEKWRKGIEGIRAQLMNTLKQHGVTAIDTTNVPFNPHDHEAVANEPVSDKEKHHTVTNVLQSGYRMNDKTIRPARVTVGEYIETN